jgi:hypothetical protein
MFKFARNTFLALTAVAAMSATAAEAVTVVAENGVYSIGYGDEFIGSVEADGGAGSWFVQFDSTEDPLLANTSATIGPVVSGTFTNLVMSWVSVSSSSVLSSISVTNPGASLDTIFRLVGLGGDDSQQYLIFTWDDSLDGAEFDFEVVAAVPLPAGGLLLIGALGGLAALRRRKTLAA